MNVADTGWQRSSWRDGRQLDVKALRQTRRPEVIRRPTLARLLLAGVLVAAAPGVLSATPIYSTPGVQNPLKYTFIATTDGDVIAYFLGSNANLTNELTMLVNGVPTGIEGLNNHTSAYGEALTLATVSAGDVLVFEMINMAAVPVGPWFSDSSLNADGANHIFSADFAGLGIIPAGTYIGFEDLPKSGADFDYNDEIFVFTNVRNVKSLTALDAPVPEPASLTLLSLGLAGVGARQWRQRKRT